MICVSEPENVPHMFENDVLETASGPDQRHSSLAGEADDLQNRFHVSVGTGRSDEEPVDPIEVPPGYFVRGDPLERGPLRQAFKRAGGGDVGGVPLVVVADDADHDVMLAYGASRSG